VPNPPWLMVCAALIQLALIAGLLTQWRRVRRAQEDVARQLAGVDQRIAGADERTSDLVHALNQPLTAILSNAQAAQRFLASEPLDRQELREILEDIVLDDKRAAGIVRRLIDAREALRAAGTDCPAVGTNREEGTG